VTCECVHEQDVLDAAATGRWPNRVDADLRAHVASCAICADLAEIAPLFAADRDAAWQEADVPSASAMWWRAQMRARREAAEKVARPMVLVQRAALAYAGVALFAMGVLLGPWIRAWARTVSGFVAWLTPTREALAAVISDDRRLVSFVVVAACCLLLAPVVVYLASADVRKPRS
jgi:hypothetical protein